MATPAPRSSRRSPSASGTTARSFRGPQRKMALYCIRDLGAPSTDAEGVAAAALGDPDVGVRLAALSTLPAVAVDRVTASRRLLSLLEDPDGGVRRAAAVALGELGTNSEEVVAALRAAAASEDASLKRAAERALRRLGRMVTASHGSLRRPSTGMCG